LQFRHHTVHEIEQPAGHVGGDRFEAVGSAGFEPLLQIVRELRVLISGAL
jgi:hypothetical protein